MKKTALVLMILTVFSSILGFAREVVLSYYYGASNISDAYIISMTIPLVIFSFIGAGISTGFIPMFSKILKDNGEEEANKFTNNLINILLLICCVLVFLGVLFAEPIVKLFASGFEGETLRIAVQFSKITILGIFFPGIIYILNGLLQIRGQYNIPTLVSFPNNLIIILTILLSYFSYVVFLPVGIILASAIQLILLFSFIRKIGFNYSFILSFKDKNIISMAIIAIPLIISVSVNQINVLIDRTLASQIAVGGISALNYANKLNGFIQGIFILSISTVIYPMISKMVVENNMKEFKKIVTDAITLINFLVIPATLGAMLFAEQIVIILFGRGAFDTLAISMTSNALFFYSIGLLGLGLGQILSKAFYSLQDTKSPMISAVISMILNIILNFILSKYLGLSGLALATSISGTVYAVILFVILRKKYGSFEVRKIVINFLKILLASLFMGLTTKGIYNVLLNNVNMYYSLITSITLGGIVFIIIVYFMKIDEIYTIINLVKKKLKKSV